jgi:hypothetical protein
MCLWLSPLLCPLRLAAPELSSQQQEQEDPGRSWHHGGPELIPFF